ncbi:AAA family ATPase [Planctomicrobium piriforme]|uniref:Predicted ATPase n=1 Tax=Planctomicrobium piriforme TaxID=1576369 RepID=A0A1I3BEQ9_9PLAN|nr:AAA family ATPase [Planctomicrobium piriforme]SFH60439.1 Predicted ATPase [Planctomicrobium piriforme]
MSVPFVATVRHLPQSEELLREFPGNLPFVNGMELEFETPVTFFVGENGSGKSTLLEAIAVLAGFPISGGSTNESGSRHGLAEKSLLAEQLRVGFRNRPRDGYFFRAELQAHFATLLDERRDDPDFAGDPYARYGGKSLLLQSHGEAFLSVMKNRFNSGLYLLDEPESALSPQRQLALLALMYQLVEKQQAQFLVATHSPILLTYPGAKMISFDDPGLPSIEFTETKHYQITHGILTRPESYWKYLREE